MRRRGPRPSYCYVCRKDSPCSGDDPCNRLEKKEKAKAYREGYYEKHGAVLNEKQKDKYWLDTNRAEIRRQQIEIRKQRGAEIQSLAEQIRQEKHNAKIAGLQRKLEAARSRHQPVSGTGGFRARQPKAQSAGDIEKEKERIKARNRESANKRRAVAGLKPMLSLEELSELRRKYTEANGTKRQRWRNVMRARSNGRGLRRKIERESDKKREQFRKDQYAQWAVLDESKTLKQLRKERHSVRMAAADTRYKESLAVMASRGGPGGPARHLNPEGAKDARKKYLRAYSAINNRKPETKAKLRDNENRQRAVRMKRRTGRCAEFYTHMLIAESAQCFYCDQLLAIHERFGDHYIPLAKGGPHTVDNLRIACRTCNSLKSDMSPDEFCKVLDRQKSMTLPTKK